MIKKGGRRRKIRGGATEREDETDRQTEKQTCNKKIRT